MKEVTKVAWKWLNTCRLVLSMMMGVTPLAIASKALFFAQSFIRLNKEEGSN
jgi:hypothetical protein